MPFYPEDVIEEVRLRNDIQNVVAEYVKLERSGTRYFGLCPFHHEKTPSFTVDPSKQFFYCFGCHKGGNVIHFVMGIENLEFPEAIRLLAEKTGMILPESDDQGEKEKALLRKNILEVNREAARYYFSCLTTDQGQIGLSYLMKRGITEKTIRQFGLGWASESENGLLKALLEKGYSESLLESAGLIFKNKKDQWADRFRKRVMYPIFDLRGNVIGFGGRILDDSQPKYVNSPETLAYSKSRELYGMNLAKNSASKKLLVVEGYMDVISLHQAGIDSAVASMGTALTTMQGRILKKYADEVVLAYDTDQAGQKATIRAIEILSSVEVAVKVLVVTDGKDPDEFVRKYGGQEFKNLMERAISQLEYKASAIKVKYPGDTLDERAAFMNSMADLLVAHENHLERDLYIQKFCKDYEIPMDSLLLEIRKRLGKESREIIRKDFEVASVSKNETGHARHDDSVLRKEKMLLGLLLRENRLYQSISQRFPVNLYSEPLREMAQMLYQKLQSGHGQVLVEFLNTMDGKAASEMITLTEKDCMFDDPVKAADDLIVSLQNTKLEQRMQEIIDQMKNISSGTDRVALQQELKTILDRLKGKK